MTLRLADALLADGIVRFLADATATATILLVASWLLALSLRRSSAAVRHRLWALTLCGLAALPVASVMAPVWRLPVLPAMGPPAGAVTLAALPPEPPTPASNGDTVRVLAPVVAVRPVSSQVISMATPVRSEGVVTGATLSHESTWRWTAAGVLIVVWIAGFLGCALPTLLCVAAGEWRRRRARLVSGGDWLALLEALCAKYSIRRHVELRESAASPIPLTWGLFRPVVLLPDDAQAWPEASRRLVLLHELAHVQRFDVAFQLAGRLAAALYWFHPLAWYALRRLKFESEQACDDCVVGAGESPADYARELLDMARSLRTTRFSASIAMARTNTLEQRMIALFDETNSQAPIDRRSGRRLVAGVALLMLGLATIHPGPSAAQPDQPAPPRQSSAEAPAKGASRIEGHVVRDADGTIAGGAEVVLLPPPPKGQDYYVGKFPFRRTLTDAKGAFAFDGLDPGRYRVWANLGMLTSRSGRLRGETVMLRKSGEPPQPVELRLVAGVALTVRVKDKITGKPIPNATVRSDVSDLPVDPKTDRDGIVRIQPLTAESGSVRVWADGFAKVSRNVNLQIESERSQEFLLGPGGVLEGVVRDSAGKPVANARVVPFVEGNNDQFAYLETKADGRFSFSNVSLNENLSIHVRNSDYLDQDVKTRLTTTKQALDLTIQARPDGGSIVGVVLDRQGRPIVDADVENMGNSSDNIRVTKTGPDGRFRLDNLFENYVGKEVLVRAKGFAPKRIKVETGPRERPNEIAITLDPAHRIKGRVTDEKDHPLEEVRVVFARANHGFSDGGTTRTDEQGRFEFDSLPANTPFAFTKEGYSNIEDQSLPLDGNDVITVVMRPAGVILGKVLDARTGQPIRRFNVRITFSAKQRPGDPTANLLTSLIDPGTMFESAEGRFKLGDLVAGLPLQVTLIAEGYEQRVNERMVVAVPDEAKAEEFRLDPIDVTSLRTYRGRLSDSKGRPVAGAQVRLIAARNRDPDQRWMFPFNWQMIENGQLARVANVTRFLKAVTDAQGRFEFTGIPKDDEVELVSWGKGIPPGRADHLELLDDAQREAIAVTVLPPAQVVGTIDRKAFPDVGQIQVSDVLRVFDNYNITLRPGQTDFVVGDLAPGKYQVVLMSPYERKPERERGLMSRPLARTEVTVAAGETKRVEFKK